MQQVNARPTFLIDAMLGNISKKLRLLGYDSEYSLNDKDDKLVQKAKSENRILITKDLLLSKKAKNQGIDVIFIKYEKELEQLTQIFKNLELTSLSISGSTTRCANCNGRLESVEKQKITNRIPQGVLEKIDNFWECSNCNKIYWEGTHIHRLQKLVDELNERL